MNSRESRKWKLKRWIVSPNCHWCGIEMLLEWDHAKGSKTPENLATVDHLRDKFDPLRDSPNFDNEERLVLACWKCNQRRGKESELRQDLEELHRRASHGGRLSENA